MPKENEHKITGYALSRLWFDWAFDNNDKVNVNHTALFLWFIEKWNRCGQVQKLSITTSESMAAIGMGSRNTYSKTLKDLVEFGFVSMVSESKNQYQCNVIMLGQNLSKRRAGTRTALDQALIQHSSKQRASIDTINKQVNQETNQPFGETDSWDQIPFDSFWNLYDKKRNREKCESLWEKINLQEREKIMQHVPLYKAEQPDPKYRKDPERYLRDKRWNDQPLTPIVHFVPERPKYVQTLDDFANEEQYELYLKAQAARLQQSA